MDWTEESEARAAQEGWQLVTTFENGDTHPLWEVVPVLAQAFIVERARCMSVFHQNVLKLIAASRLRTT